MDLDDEYDSDFIQPDNEDSGYSTDSDATITTTTSTTSHHEHQESYTILSEADIYQLLDKDITRISTVLSISRASASILLQNYNWSVSKVNDTWFSDEEKVRRDLGLLENQIQIVEANCQPSKRCTRELNCMICLDTYPRAKMDAAECGHSFCIACWTNYISTSICNGPGCLMLRCPDQFCKVVVGHDMINKLAHNKDKEKYSRYLVRSYVEHNRRTKWCPAPDCTYAVDFDISSSRYDINCKCSYSFCWNCTEEVHRPVDCTTVAKWNLKNIDESENTNWILANTKPCPKCKRPIEKNSGCMSMTCGPPCRFRFCWLCLGAGGYHNVETCNAYKLEGGVDDETERNREMAQKHIRRYTHYYERWAVNHSSRQKALADLEKMQNMQIEKFVEKGYQITQLKFITEAWLQIVECRRVLKWTYAYGYYLPKHEDAKRQLFEFLQGQAESGLERLHQCSEKELEVHLNAENPSNGFNEFRMKLTGLTKVTGNYFENLVKALENDLSDVNSQGTSSKMEN